jgi:hypothetical protein
MIDSTDAAATLAEFGFTPDLAASAASLNGDVEWHPDAEQPWLASLRGTVSMRLADGTLTNVRRVEGAPRVDGTPRAASRDGGDPRSGDTRFGDARPGRGNGELSEANAGLSGALTDVGGAFITADARGAEAGRAEADAGTHPFALLAVPALVSGLDAPGAAGASLTKEQHPLHFAHLKADFELQDGQAITSNLHFDGDAEILMRGRIGIVARDYDQQVWLLRGEERLPAAVRRFGATPRVAAAWLSLRDIFGGSGSQDRSRAVLRLQGSWDDPMVVTAN